MAPVRVLDSTALLEESFVMDRVRKGPTAAELSLRLGSAAPSREQFWARGG